MSNAHGDIVVGTINAQGVSDGPRLTLENVRDQLAGVSIAALQEVENLRGTHRLRARLSRLLGVEHSLESPARAGVAIVWDKADAELVKRHRPVELVTPLRGMDMRARPVVACDFRLVDGRTITFGSVHRPPARHDELWPVFDAALARWIKVQSHPVIVGLDANARILPRLVGWEGRHLMAWNHCGIDGFLYDTGRLDLGAAFRLPSTGSDHRPVVAKLEPRA